MKAHQRLLVWLVALLLAAFCGPSLATVPEAVPPYVKRLPRDIWVVAPARPCEVRFCEAASNQSPVRFYVREFLGPEPETETFLAIAIDGCGAYSSAWEDSTGLSAAEKVAAVQRRAKREIELLVTYCGLDRVPAYEIGGLSELFKRIGQ